MIDTTSAPAAPGRLATLAALLDRWLPPLVTVLLFYTPFPIILLLLMGRQSAKNDLVGPTPAPM